MKQLREAIESVAAHSRRAPRTAASLDRASLDAALSFYRNRFGNASNFTFVIVGNVDAAALKPLVEQYIASLPGHPDVPPRPDAGAWPPMGTHSVVVDTATDPRSTVEMVFYQKHVWRPDSSVRLTALETALSIRLREVLRQDMGRVYDVVVAGAFTLRPSAVAAVVIVFSCAPSDVAALKAAVFAEVRSMRRRGVSDALAAKVREMMRRQLESGLRQNAVWLGLLSDHYRLESDPRSILGRAAETDLVSAARIQTAAKQFLNLKRHIVAVLNPR